MSLKPTWTLYSGNKEGLLYSENKEVKKGKKNGKEGKKKDKKEGRGREFSISPVPMLL